MRLYNVVHILVGTPGRVLDLADKGIANLKECSTLIMDEVALSNGRHDRPVFEPAQSVFLYQERAPCQGGNRVSCPG